MQTKNYLLFLVLFMYIGCTTDDAVTPSQEIQGSLFVTIKDLNGVPVQGALLDIGTKSGVTDIEGNCFFTAITLTGSDYIRVQKDGYFHGSRRFRTQGSQTQYVHITLMPQVEKGSFTNSQSATITIDNKSKLHFPANAVVRENGSAYTGSVHVMAQPIYGDDPKLSEKMPGSLIGTNEAGTMMALGSFGMLAVDLYSDTGEKLKIAEGQTVEMELAIANEQLNKAPATIPMWSFDEEKGLWIQEGIATRQGNVYVASLPHFSFWNCDIELTLVNWGTKMVLPNGKPAPNTKVCLTLTTWNDQRCAYTDAEGWVGGEIPANEPMILNVLNECNESIFELELAGYTADIELDPITIEANESFITSVNGTALQCDGLPVKAGFVKVYASNSVYVYPINGADGTYSGEFIYCQGDLITVKFIDLVNQLESRPFSFTHDRELNFGSLLACNQLTEFLRFRVKGFATDYVYSQFDVKTSGFTTEIYSLDSIGVKGKFEFSFDGNTPGSYKGWPRFGNQINLPNGQVAYINEMNVNVTEFGGHLELIKGDFNGKINAGGNGAGGSGWSDFSGTFAVENR